jgi:hypothetical protein
VLIALVGLASVSWAQEVETGGHVAINLRLSLACNAASFVGDCPWLDFHDAAVVGGFVDVRHQDKAAARLAVDLRLHGPSAISALEDAGDPQLSQATSLKLHDAWVALYDVGIQGFDLIAGARKLNWGSGAGFHPVDVVNPYDLENPTRFGERLAIPLLGAELHRGSFAAELVVAPWFVPAWLPADGVDLMSDGEEVLAELDTGTDGVEIRDLESRVEREDDRLAEVSVGARVSWASPAGDLALSFYRGRDSLPQVSGEVRITGFSTDNDKVDLGIPIAYPRVMQFGAEWVGELPWLLTGWVEAALVFPEATQATFSQSQLESLERLGTIDEVPDPIPSVVTQDGRAFGRWVVGLDRGLGPVYVNVQWLHGFPTERQREDLRDYGVLGMRWSAAPNLAFSGQLLSDARGALTGARVDWLYADVVEVWAAISYGFAPPESSLYAFRGMSHVGLGTQIRF